MNKVFCLGCLTVWLVGCACKSTVEADSKPLRSQSVAGAVASSGGSSHDDKLARIKCGVTTEAQLLAWFGPASSRQPDAAGGQKLTWKSENLMALLDASGKVIGVVVSPVLIR